MLPALSNVPRETQTRMDAYVDLLRRWNRALNLVSANDLAKDMSERHIGQSLAVAAHIPAGIDRFIDLGSGGGFPGLPIAIATGYHVDLVEADKRKAAFLNTALAALGVRGTVWADRIEDCGVAPAACITARALAPMPQLLTYANTLLRPGGVALFLKGDRVEAELEAAKPNWAMEAELIALDDKGSRLVKISRLERAHDPQR